MREILFRGKKVINDEWVEGLLVEDTEFYGEPDFHTYIVNHKHPSGCFGGDIYFEVDPETVGQYTGLTDKNGKKIFEGDILSTHFDLNNPEDESRTVVEWGNFRWVTHQPGYEPDDITDFDKGLWTVIGNIHDNPELMEDERHG